MALLDGLKESVANAVASFRKEVASTRSQLETARRRREDLLTAPLCKADVVELLHEYIDCVAPQYPAILKKAFAGVLREGTALKPELVGSFIHGGLLAATEGPQPGHAANTEALHRGLLFLLRDPIKVALRDAIDQMEWPSNPGLPRKEREAELKRLDREIAALQSKLHELDDEKQRIVRTFE